MTLTLGEINVSPWHTIVIDGIKFSTELLRQMIPEEGKERTWEITREDGSIQRGRFARSGCVVIITTNEATKKDKRQ